MAKTVLIIEDDRDLSDWLSYELETEGYHVLVANHGKAGIEVAQTCPNLILLDVQLPGMDGFEVCQTLQQQPETAAIPIIFLTAHSGLESKLSGFDSGAIDYVTKPFMMPELKARIKASFRSRLVEQQRATADLEQYKTYLSQNLSHELRTPMSVILSALDIMDYTANKKNFGELNAIIETAQSGAYRLYWLIQDLLIVNKLEQTDLPIFRHPTELKPVVDSVLEQIRTKYSSKELVLDLNIAETDKAPMLQSHITDVMRHLLDNACKFSPQKGTITLDVKTSHQAAKICVSDQGLGISPEQQEAIFNKFYQTDMSTTRGAQGMGVGLYIARSLAQLYGGDIELHSEVGYGSRFCLTLPYES